MSTWKERWELLHLTPHKSVCPGVKRVWDTGEVCVGTLPVAILCSE